MGARVTPSAKTTIRNLERVLQAPPPPKPPSASVSTRVPRSVPGQVQAIWSASRVGLQLQERLTGGDWEYAETLNARLSMTGHVVGPLVYMDTGLPLVEQVHEPASWVLLVCTVVYFHGLSSFMWPMLDRRGYAYVAEMMVGHLSMLWWILVLIEINL